MGYQQNTILIVPLGKSLGGPLLVVSAAIFSAGKLRLTGT